MVGWAFADFDEGAFEVWPAAAPETMGSDSFPEGGLGDSDGGHVILLFCFFFLPWFLVPIATVRFCVLWRLGGSLFCVLIRLFSTVTCL